MEKRNTAVGLGTSIDQVHIKVSSMDGQDEIARLEGSANYCGGTRHTIPRIAYPHGEYLYYTTHMPGKRFRV